MGSLMLQELFNEQKSNVDFFFQNVDLKRAEAFFDLLKETDGMIFFTGVGKSGFVAQKVATTMTSVNVKSLYLSPIDALHGDIGMLSRNDVFVLMSRSGETDELIELLPFLRNKGVKLVALVCEERSTLGRGCDLEMVLPIEKEICPFNLMPTTSAAVMMIFGDIIATALMKERELKIEEYRLNHPAGRIGKRMTMRVQDLMLQGDRIPTVGPYDRVMDILVELSNKQCGCVVVVDQKGAMLGIFTDGDLRRTLQKHGEGALRLRLEDVMTVSPRSTTPDRLAFEAMKLMESSPKSPITVLPVVECERLIGLIKMHDIIQSGI